MVLKKEALCRIVVYGANNKEKKQLWSGTVYRSSVFTRADQVINRIKRFFE